MLYWIVLLLFIMQMLSELMDQILIVKQAILGGYDTQSSDKAYDCVNAVW